jgi:two-component system, cell cycle response regulator DivK
MAGERILVVEDNEMNMKLFRDVLQAKGYSTLEATTGEDAVELAQAFDPALVLMDVHLPGIDGVEALAHLRGDERTSAIPVVALTAQAMSGDRKRFLEVGFDGYLSKPVDLVELIRVVESTAFGPPPANDRQTEALLSTRRRLVLAAAADRGRIERELHDGVQQRLAALAGELQQARRLVERDPGAAAPLIDDMAREVAAALGAARTLAHRIHPPLLHAGGLRTALRTTAAMLDVPTRVEVPEELDLPSELAVVLYFSCADTLEHLGGSTKIAITVRRQEDDAVFAILAEGSDVPDTDLTPVRDRLEALGGRLTVDSEPGRTVITGRLPDPGSV